MDLVSILLIFMSLTWPGPIFRLAHGADERGKHKFTAEQQELINHFKPGDILGVSHRKRALPFIVQMSLSKIDHMGMIFNEEDQWVIYEYLEGKGVVRRHISDFFIDAADSLGKMRLILGRHIPKNASKNISDEELLSIQENLKQQQSLGKSSPYRPHTCIDSVFMAYEEAGIKLEVNFLDGKNGVRLLDGSYVYFHQLLDGALLKLVRERYGEDLRLPLLSSLFELDDMQIIYITESFNLPRLSLYYSAIEEVVSEWQNEGDVTGFNRLINFVQRHSARRQSTTESSSSVQLKPIERVALELDAIKSENKSSICDDLLNNN